MRINLNCCQPCIYMKVQTPWQPFRHKRIHKTALMFTSVSSLPVAKRWHSEPEEKQMSIKDRSQLNIFNLSDAATQTIICNTWINKKSCNKQTCRLKWILHLSWKPQKLNKNFPCSQTLSTAFRTLGHFRVKNEYRKGKEKH